ncbi:MAG: hypothetical protein K0R03_2369 [Moraxellaceae bacterium]|jgi:hypothetical protein|nr:hypothetical protein [Moraxellaceae bacterium]MDF3031811.1 hypothetical protein [Moraxellaceae bacterium]
MTRNVLIAGSLGAALLLGACNSDSSITSPGAVTAPPGTPAAGSWLGSIDSPTPGSRTARAVVLPDGSFWLVYSLEGDTSTAGIIRGTGTTDGTNFTVTDANLLSLEDGKQTTADITATFVNKNSFAGTITQDGSTALTSPAVFSSLYRTAFDTNLTLADLAGTYDGVITTKTGEETANFAISDTGAIAGGSTSGCSVAGQATAQSAGNVFNITATFGKEDACGANKDVSVVGILSLEVDTVTALALNGDSSNSFIFTGTRP